LPQAPTPASEPRRATPPLLQPLLDPLWERGILIEAIGTPVAGGFRRFGEVLVPEKWGRLVTLPPADFLLFKRTQLLHSVVTSEISERPAHRSLRDGRRFRLLLAL
jgi:hypothetical protein